MAEKPNISGEDKIPTNGLGPAEDRFGVTPEKSSLDYINQVSPQDPVMLLDIMLTLQKKSRTSVKVI